ncbi:MAG: N-acetylmuramoyl-L-alanine amidase, partial [Clostridia bacterium]|nr:N-acetylmuramoyl-L-alanine amidase [Clostridia bacterium]
MRHLKFFTAFFLFSAFIFYYALRLFAWVTPITEVTTGKEGEVTDFTVVLDAGHGGEDSGAVGVTGVLEKDLNFEVVSVLSALLRASGCEVVLTRTEDKLLYT